MLRSWWRPVTGAVILLLLGWRIGAGPFLDGLRGLSLATLLAAVLVTAVTTICSAARWRVIAAGLGVGLTLRGAVAAYYRSQFLNSALPGGVLGDVHRGMRHGQDVENVGGGLRAVALERTAGQFVQTTLAVVVLLVLASPVRSAMPKVLLITVLAVLVAALLVRRFRLSRLRLGRAIGSDLRRGLLHRGAWPTVLATSAAVVAGHAVIFFIAARASGAEVSWTRLLPLTMLALLAMSVPLSVGGWGPREGVTAWAFAAAGLGVDQGIATATAYGVMAFVATLPGAILLVTDALRRRPVAITAAVPMPMPMPVPMPVPVHAIAGAGAGHG
ncbi:Uncharacterized membrane protein YbhN, UPF0104 family [Frankineae bacterium MT45]|nr:Uncharacterized membrane protein YbhN, UPF0104 family [Frankineae bacterium MT45]